MAKKQNNRKQPWSIPLIERESLYNGINPSADFGIGSFISQGIGYLGGFRTGQGMNEDEARWAAYLGLPYDKEYAPDTNIRFEQDKNYPDRQYQGLSRRAKNEIREDVIPEAKRIKDKYNKEWIQVLDERGTFGNDSTIYHPRETYTGDLGKFGIREVGNSGIYEVGDKYDFPSWIPVPDRNEGTELMIRDTIWSDRANPKLYNKEIMKRKNKHSIGGLLGKLGDWNTNVTNNMFTNSSTGQATGFGKFAKGFGINSGNIGGISNIGATAIGGFLAGKNKTGVGSAMQTIGSLASNIPGVGGLIGAGVNMVGGLVNAAFGSNINKEFVNQTEAQARQQSNYFSGASDNASLLSDWDALTFLGDIKKSDVGSDGWFSNKAGRETARLNALVDEANAKALASISNTAENIDKQNDLMMFANYTAYGGPLNMEYTGVMSPFGNRFKDGGIFIKPSKRGTFTAAAKKRGMGVQEFASKVLANKEDYSPAMVKKANFARNASKWKHDDGGQLFTNGVTMVGNGGTHEQNPMEGVPMGIDPNGIPNLVEEGEVIYNDYVFSNRLNVPDAVREKYKLRGNKELTFADAAKQMQKESEERPNDPISKRGLESAMLRLQQAQEAVREEKQASQEGREYAHGGKMGILFDGLGEDSNWLYTPFGSPTREDVLMEMEETYPFLKGEEMSIAPIVRGAGISDTNTGTNSKSSRNLSWLRYAPVVGAAIGFGQNLLSRPDYSSPNAILAAAERAGTYTPVRYSPVGNYLTYTPFDRDYYINKLNADTAASRRGLVNTSGGNRAAAMAGILASDYNYGNQLGALARQAEEYNLAQRQAVETFNRATNMANAEMGLKAAMANQEAALNAGRTRLSGTAQAMAMRDEIAARRGASMSANLTNLFDSLGNIGIDEMNRADRDMLIRAGVFGTLSEKPQGWSNKRWEDYKKTISGKGYSRGGQLKKKRGGFTY